MCAVCPRAPPCACFAPITLRTGTATAWQLPSAVYSCYFSQSGCEGDLAEASHVHVAATAVHAARQNASARRARRSVRRTLNSREQCRFWKVRHFAVPPRRRTPHVRSSVSREMSIIMTSWIMRLRNPPVDPRGGKSSAHFLRTFHACTWCWHQHQAHPAIRGLAHCHPSHQPPLQPWAIPRTWMRRRS